MLGALVFEEEPEYSVVDFSVHDHGLEHGALPNDKLDHTVDETQLGSIYGDHYRHLRLVDQPVILLLVILVLGTKFVMKHFSKINLLGVTGFTLKQILRYTT